jgi:hypothetical protein
MINNIKKISLIIAILIAANGVFAAEMEFRAWQFHKLLPGYVMAGMNKAQEYDINTVIFSHHMIYRTDDLFDGSPKGERLSLLAEKAHELDMRVWIWLHELERVPERFRDGKVVDLDREGFWAWLTERYEKVFTGYPQFDGVVMTFHETENKIFDPDEVRSSLSNPERFARMIETINGVCRKYDKDCVIRTFLYEPKQLEWIKEALEEAPEDVIIQSKCVPHDWQPYYPHNPVIGAFPEHRQIVEFDASSEFTGKSRIPYTSPDYFEYRWRHGMSFPNTAGYIARVDHGGFDAISTPNAINLYTLYRLTEDPSVTADDIWEEWTQARYGKEAAFAIEQALRRSFDIVNKSFFPLKFWITNHSEMPDFDYAQGHISGRTIAKWKPGDESLKKTEQRLNHPDAEILEEILAEKDEAIALADEALYFFYAAQPFLEQKDFNDLFWRFQILQRLPAVYRLHAEAFFGYKVLAEGHQVPGLRERVERALDGMDRQAGVGYVTTLTRKRPPLASRDIKRAARELREMLEELPE